MRTYILLVVLQGAIRPWQMRYENRAAAVAALEFFQSIPGTYVTLVRDEA
jgi:hypothetical protein